MKIKDVTLKEAAPGKVPPQPTLNGKPSTGPKGQKWLQKYGATHNPDGTPKVVDAMAGASAPTAGTATTITNPAQAAQAPDRAADPNVAGVAKAPDAAPPVVDPTPAIDPSVAAGQNLGAMAAKEKDTKSLADFQKLSGMTPTTSEQPAAVAYPAPQSNVPPGLASATTPQGSAENPAGQAAQPAAPAPQPAAPAPQPAAPAAVAPEVTSSSGQAIKTGTGGTLKSRSQDEFAWASKQPMGGTGQQYPGAGNWDPKTGRTIKKEQAIESAEMQLIKKLAGLR